MWTTHSTSAEETRALGRRLAAAAEAGLVVCLQGDLGAGKTCFAQGVGEGLGIEDDVVSPTFTLVAEHEASASLPLLHADLYRLDSYAELAGIGFEELVEDWPGVSLIEWADRFPDAAPDDRLWIHLAIGTGSERRFVVTASGACAVRVLARWRGDG
jgi:tRNA threonylcarbamoyladenosine biosynthesis protein TsaE